MAGLSTLKRGSTVAFLRLARRAEVVARPPPLRTGRGAGVWHVVSAAAEQRGAKGHHDNDGFHNLGRLTPLSSLG